MMNVIQTGTDYRIYDSSVIQHTKLPPKVYDVNVSQTSGWYLTDIGGVEEYKITEKIYGNHQQKVDKIFRGFSTIENRGMGVIFSGDKGLGKSLSMRLLILKALNNNLPVILVNHYIAGIADFLESIEQEAVVCFDEFDKTFGLVRYNRMSSDNREDRSDPMVEMLTLFDGLGKTKKLYVITCNNIRSLNEYLLNRPGRMHYHIRFECPRGEAVKEYLVDKCGKEQMAEISKVVKFSYRVPLNYDCLRAIAFELNLGASFEDSLSDLNIINIENIDYDFYVKLENDIELTGVEDINPFRKEETRVYLKEKGTNFCDSYIIVNPLDSLSDGSDGTIVLDHTQLKLYPNDVYGDELKAWHERYDGFDIIQCEMKPHKATFDYRWLL